MRSFVPTASAQLQQFLAPRTRAHIKFRKQTATPRSATNDDSRGKSPPFGRPLAADREFGPDAPVTALSGGARPFVAAPTRLPQPAPLPEGPDEAFSLLNGAETTGEVSQVSRTMRQWAAHTHWALLDCYSLGFRFTLAAEQLDKRGRVVDFGAGGFDRIRSWLRETRRSCGSWPGEHPEVPGFSSESLAEFIFSRGPCL